MPTITLNKKVFEQLVGKELPLEELKDRISMLGTDLESIEGNEITVEIFPNRPDLLSVQGFARAFSSFIGEKVGLKYYDIKSSGQKVIVEESVKVVRPYTACAIIKNINFDDEKIKEIIQIQEKLHITYGRNRKKMALGVYPMEKIGFPITYKAEDPNKIKFQPLEANKEMTGLQILSQHKTGREFGHLLEGQDKFPIFVDNNNQVLSMPPIINSDNLGKITEETKEVFIECSGFDYEVLSKCLNMVVTAFAEMGGEIYSLELDYPDSKKTSPDLTPEKMKLDLRYINKWLGLNLSEEEAKTQLEKMGYGYENGIVMIPAYRSDILHQVDLAEDIAIAYGYENFEETIPNVATVAEEDPLEKFSKKIREILVGLKLLEVKNYHLITKENLNEKMLLENEIIPLKNALGEHNHLRNWILPSLLLNLKDNQHHEYPQNIFEIGRTFVSGDTETKVVETEHLGITICHEKTDFTEVRQILAALMGSLGLEFSVKETSHPSFILGRVGEIIIKDIIVGFIGELSPKVLNNWELVVPVVGMELDLEKLFEVLKENKK
ncbi:phenylalanine--tRNA ligase subunit beta [Candidatus Woesearchaeota archaeon]|jgi:phenylalanyl-tRNA synthetase beta chain|nr:phenylalanine--tRNA ligase subunit beta [Candidatus Woesearchaeota archaeon]MBT4110342.1 phenylalanine--tRNA ligase subunit beta [Candidatus Woesearchaeota archaeon]MBT4336134.1 phenylalanine--tRNA ligase subunit beta [Candidatus Woesearchaeota archaeon]MBT4468887.1 phenylalanine--tRNA ligase subunit beta [Candidatus Woesearchaeota archaeon]MBT6744794.1 phenylalanine--tRNA ligase subunit beta [Candidatus Woesearchaeota archaeon]